MSGLLIFIMILVFNSLFCIIKFKMEGYFSIVLNLFQTLGSIQFTSWIARA